jgi:hypothetical protein
VVGAAVGEPLGLVGGHGVGRVTGPHVIGMVFDPCGASIGGGVLG